MWRPRPVFGARALPGSERDARDQRGNPAARPATCGRAWLHPSCLAKGLVQAGSPWGWRYRALPTPISLLSLSVVEVATQRGWNVVVDDFGHGSGSGLDAVSRRAHQVDALVGYLGPRSNDAQAMMGRCPVVVLDYPKVRAAGGIAFDYSHGQGLRSIGSERTIAGRSLTLIQTSKDPSPPGA